VEATQLQEGLNQAKVALSEAERDVAVLRKLLDEAESKLANARNALGDWHVLSAVRKQLSSTGPSERIELCSAGNQRATDESTIFTQPPKLAWNPDATQRGLEAERQLAIVRGYPESPMKDKWIRKAEQRIADASMAAAVRATDDKKAEEKAAHDEEHKELNHRSASAVNASDLRQAVLDYLKAHGSPGDWHPRTRMCIDIHAWIRWGKRVVDPTLNEMVAEGLIEVKSDQVTRFVRLCCKAA